MGVGAGRAGTSGVMADDALKAGGAAVVGPVPVMVDGALAAAGVGGAGVVGTVTVLADGALIAAGAAGAATASPP